MYLLYKGILQINQWILGSRRLSHSSALMLCDSHTFQREEEKYDERKNIYFAMHILGMHNAFEFQITLLRVK